MLGGLTGWHLLIILAVILLIFGAPKLPGLAKSIGQSMRIFKGEINEMKKDGQTTDQPAATDSTVAPTAPIPPATPPAAAPPVTPSSETHPKP
jgi:sec-independent protein translocase protein TatA